jgi:hypothetical protein
MILPSSYDRPTTVLRPFSDYSDFFVVCNNNSLSNAKERSKALLESSHIYHQAAQTKLIATIDTGYYQLLLLDEQLKI